MRWYDKNRVSYILGLARKKVLERGIQPLMDHAQELYEQTQLKQRLFGEETYAAKLWDLML